jgi:serine/threonine protein kinase
VCTLVAGGELFEQLSAKGHYRERDAASIMRTLLQVRWSLHYRRADCVSSLGGILMQAPHKMGPCAAMLMCFLCCMQVVQHCHSMNVVHRDLKPENFLFKVSRDASFI